MVILFLLLVLFPWWLLWFDQFGIKISWKGLTVISCVQLNLREALSSHSVEYRKTYLAALGAVLLTGDSSTCQLLRQSSPQEEPLLPGCVGLLLGDLEDQRGGSEFLSEALVVTSLLLSQWPDSRFGFFHISTHSCARSLLSLTLF